jgi:hypothetical protein
MIVEHRTYTIQVGQMNAYRDYLAQHGLAVQQRILGNLIGFFTSDIGELNQAIQMWGYESYADRETRRAELSGNAEWLEYLKGSPKVILRQENRILLPTGFSPIR